MHASTPGTTAWRRTCKEPLQTKEALHFSFVRRNQTTFRTSNAKTSLYPRPAAPIPLHPHPLFPTYPRTVRGRGQAQFYCEVKIAFNIA